MNALVLWLGRLVDGILTPFDLGPEWLGLVLFSAVSGVAILWSYGKLTNQARLQRGRDAMAAAIYEIRIFSDSPRRIVSAQARLAYGSILYTLYTLPALLAISAPLALLYVHLEARHAYAPLDRRAPVLLHAVLAAGTDADDVQVVEEGPIHATAPALFVGPTRELYIRLAPPGDAKSVTLRAGGRTVEKAIDGPSAGSRFISPERSSGLAALVAVTEEAPIPAGAGIESIGIPHAARDVRLIFGAPWWVHWFIFSSVFALAVRKRLGVVI